MSEANNKVLRVPMKSGRTGSYNTILIISIFAVSGIILFLGFRNQSEKINGGVREDSSCSITKEEKIVRGNSMSPFIKNGQVIEAWQGYYQCHKVERDDIILLHYSGDKNPLIKLVKGIPGDKFQLQQTREGWNILINGRILENTGGIPYLISGNRYKMLSLYERDYKGIIPQNSYLVLGEESGGSVDSTRFGLIDKSAIIAKVQIKN